MRYQKLLAELPPKPSPWRQWTGSGMVWTGQWLMRWGERMAQRECQENLSIAS
jgi:hypothetical protein